MSASTKVLPIFICVLGSIACGPATDDTVVRVEDRAVDAPAFAARIDQPRYDALRTQPEALKAAVLRDLVIETSLLVEPPTPDEAALVEQIATRQTLERCASIELRRRWSTANENERYARAYFEDHRSEFDVPDTFILQMIFLPADDPDADAVAQDLLHRVTRDPGSFGELAARHSKSETASAEGMTPPLKATDLHPMLRRDIAAHRDSESPFLVRIDRGIYIIRIVNYLEGAAASFDRVAKKVDAAARQDFTRKFHEENTRAFLGSETLTLDRNILHSPEVVDGDAVVYSVGDRSYSVRDIVPGWRPEPPTTGPMLRRAQEHHLDLLAIEGNLECPSTTDDTDRTSILLSLRFGPTLRAFVADHMLDDLEQFLATHEAVMRVSGRHVLDLFVLPPKSGDPYADLESFDLLARDLEAGSATADTVDAAGGLAYEHITADVQLLAAYDPSLPARLRQLSEGDVCRPFYSKSAQAYLAIRLRRFEPDRPFDLDRSDDLDRIATLYLNEARDTALARWYEALAEQAAINDRLVDRLIDDAGESAGDPPAETGE